MWRNNIYLNYCSLEFVPFSQLNISCSQHLVSRLVYVYLFCISPKFLGRLTWIYFDVSCFIRWSSRESRCCIVFWWVLKDTLGNVCCHIILWVFVLTKGNLKLSFIWVAWNITIFIVLFRPNHQAVKWLKQSESINE